MGLRYARTTSFIDSVCWSCCSVSSLDKGQEEGEDSENTISVFSSISRWHLGVKVDVIKMSDMQSEVGDDVVSRGI